jgi:hypothetical protein
MRFDVGFVAIDFGVRIMRAGGVAATQAKFRVAVCAAPTLA